MAGDKNAKTVDCELNGGKILVQRNGGIHLDAPNLLLEVDYVSDATPPWAVVWVMSADVPREAQIPLVVYDQTLIQALLDNNSAEPFANWQGLIRVVEWDRLYIVLESWNEDPTQGYRPGHGYLQFKLTSTEDRERLVNAPNVFALTAPEVDFDPFSVFMAALYAGEYNPPKPVRTVIAAAA